jgi:hypothetical protein
MPRQTSFGDFLPADELVPCWEIVQRQKFFSVPVSSLRKGDEFLGVVKDGYLEASASHPTWSAKVERSQSHQSVRVNFACGCLLAQFYVLIESTGDLRASHSELANIRRSINGVELCLVGIGTAKRREAWKDSDSGRQVVGFIDILELKDPAAEQLLVWLCFVIGTMVWLDTGD